MVVRVEGGARADAARLGRRVADRVVGAEAPAGLVDERRRRRAATDHELADRGEVALVEAGVAEEQGDLGGHAAEHRQPHALGQVEHVGGPPAGEQVGGRSEPQVPGQLGGEPDVGELGAGQHRHRRAVAPPVGDVDVGDRGQLAVGERRAAGQPGRARREHHHDGAVGVGGKLGPVPPAAVRDESRDLVGRRDDDGRVDDVEAGLALGFGQPGVDAGGDRSRLGGAEVGDHVGGGGGEGEGHDRSGAGPLRPQRRGGRLAAPVELGVAERGAVRIDERRGGAEAVGRLADDLGDQRADLLGEIEVEHADRVAPHDLVDALVVDAGHHLLGHLLGVGPGGIGVRVVGLERDVVHAHLVE